MIPAFVFVLTLILCMNVSGLELLLDHSNAMIVNIVLSQHFYVYVYVYECGNWKDVRIVTIKFKFECEG